MLLYTQKESARLSYIVDFISRELFASPISITTDAEKFKKYQGPRINYSERDFSESEFFIKCHPLLFEMDIRKQDIECFELNFHKAFFATSGDLPFDIFAASFYLLSRYEEYLPHPKDSYGRFDSSHSLAFKEDFLHEPLVNLWLEDLKKALIRKFPELLFRQPAFTCLLTYDIDMAYAYRYKGLLVNSAGILRDLAKLKFKDAGQRWRVIRKKEKDPYDCFEWLDALHLYCRVKPYYFFLVAKKKGMYDKNNSTNIKPFKDLIEYYAHMYKTGLHPSWQSGDDHELLKEEKEWLEVVASEDVTISRQHYIRLSLPETYRRLLKVGIEKDFSMGYGDRNGFRASVCSSYLWYDLEKESPTSLWIYPFCFMDANSYFEQKLNPGAAYNELMRYYSIVKKHRGIFISIWHNNILGTHPGFAGWREMYELFMKETVYWDAYNDHG